MANIKRAEREGKGIRLEYDCLDEQKIYLCVTNPRGDVISKPAKKGENLEVLFQWETEEEAEDFQEAYVADQAKKALSQAVAIVETVPPNAIRGLFYKAFGIPFLLLFLFVVALRLSSPKEIFQAQLAGAYFQDAATIRVEGNLSVEKGSLAKILDDVRIQLLRDGIVEREIPLKEISFVLEIPCVWDAQKRYEVRCLYKDKPLSSSLRRVQFHRQYPIATLQKFDWQPHRLLVGSVFTLYGVGHDLDVELYSPHGVLLASQRIVGKTLEQVPIRLGPVEEYAPSLLLLLKAGYAVLDRKSVAFSSPCGKILSASFSGLTTISIQGFWRGPATAAHVSLEILEKPDGQALHQKSVPRDFTESFPRMSVTKEYVAQLRHGEDILTKVRVLIPDIYREYTKLVGEMPSLASDLAFLLCSASKDPAKRAMQISPCTQTCANYAKQCESLQKKEDKSLALDSLEKFYRSLEQMATSALALQGEVSSPHSTVFETLLYQKEGMENLLELLNAIFMRFHPESKALSPFLDSLAQKKAREKWATLLEYLNSCALSGQYGLGLEVCEGALLEYPSDWQFLLGRYYLQLLAAEEDPSRRKVDKQKFEEDQRKLLRVLQVEFQKQLMDLHYNEAYEIGEHLLALRPQFPEVAEKMRSLQDKISPSAPRQLRFTYESLRRGKK